MFSTFIIALREGLEASLIVGILLAYLHKSERKSLRGALWTGVTLAVALSLGLGAFLTFTSHELPKHGEEVFAGTLAVVAVALVTAMVFWMKRTARNMRTELEGKASQAAHLGTLAMIATAFVAVAREGLETALFLYTNFATVKTSRGPGIGLILGLGAAIALGFLIYRRTISINLGKFFKVTGIALIVVAAGVLANGIGDLQGAGWIPGSGARAWNIESWLSPDSLIASALAGSIGFSSVMTWLQVATWAAYISTVLTIFLKAGAPKIVAQKVTQ